MSWASHIALALSIATTIATVVSYIVTIRVKLKAMEKTVDEVRKELTDYKLLADGKRDEMRDKIAALDVKIASIHAKE